ALSGDGGFIAKLMKDGRIIKRQRHGKRMSEPFSTIQCLTAVFHRLVRFAEHPENVTHIGKAKYTEVGSKKRQMQSLICCVNTRQRLLQVLARLNQFSEMKQTASNREVSTRNRRGIVSKVDHLQ